MNSNDCGARDQITAVILAGGRARRMGGMDKGLIPVAGKPLIEYVIDTLSGQTPNLLINANRNRERYAAYGYEVIADVGDDYCGPLAGMLSGLQHARTGFVLTVPCDSPYVPADLVARMWRRLREGNGRLCVLHDGERMQPVFSLLSRELVPDLENWLAAGMRKTEQWLDRHRPVLADFSDCRGRFINLNTPADVAAFEASLPQRRKRP